jgi:uncharacterized membrane protein
VNRGRLEAFSDGVFAVAITLLVLDLAVAGPGPGHGSLAHQLAHRWPGFAAYVISFLTIGIIWVNHHALVSNLKVVTRPLMFLNLLLLMFVVLVPFTTATVANYLADGGFDAQVAVAVFGGAMLGMSVSFAAMFEWSLGEGRAYVSVPRDKRWAARFRFTSGGLVYLAIIGIAFLSAPVAFGLAGATGVYYIFERTPVIPKPEGQSQGRSQGQSEGQLDG